MNDDVMEVSKLDCLPNSWVIGYATSLENHLLMKWAMLFHVSS